MEAMTTDTANADIRAVFFDIDGTLTSFTTHTVPDSTIEAIHRLQAAGVKVLICTGRAPSQMHVVLEYHAGDVRWRGGVQWAVLF